MPDENTPDAAPENTPVTPTPDSPAPAAEPIAVPVAEPVAATPQMVNFSISGKITGTAEVPLGTTIKQAIAKITNGAVDAAGYVYRDAASKVVTLGQKVNAAMTLTAVAAASGG